MTDAALAQAYDDAERIEREVRRCVAVEQRPFELARGQAVYRGAVQLRKALEDWITTRAQSPRHG